MPNRVLTIPNQRILRRIYIVKDRVKWSIHMNILYN